MKTLTALLVLAALPAAARSRPAKPPADLSALTAMSRHYVKIEKIVSTSTVPLTMHELGAHWDELHALRMGFERLDQRGELRHLKEGRRVVVRHVLAQILGEQTEVALDDKDPRLAEAHDRRADDLSALSTLARRAFDIAIADANGSWPPG